ncbi:MAG: hypothetical protein KKC03_02730 [Bacteroidetes bacterium]|nr:hypothetical protein [Bacteroidota bacterium]
MKNISKFGVVSLCMIETESINGGWALFCLGLAIAMINDADNNPDDFKAGYNAIRGDFYDAL